MPNTDNLNRTVFISDNLPFLQSLDAESVDLVVIDPPFGKKRTFTGTLKPPLSDLERERERARMEDWGVYDAVGAYEMGIEYPDQSGDTALFNDVWRFERVVREDWWRRIQDTPVWWLIESTRRTRGDDMAAYIAFMAQRITEIRRILRPTGSAYLHCDHEANAYLRQMMDAAFGTENFRNEIVWSYRTGGVSKRYFPRKHDAILFYSKSNSYAHNPIQERIYYDKPFFNEQVDEEGRYYADVYIRDVWDDIKPLINVSGERAGYPTQKPQALARRIIEASSNPGDMVLDCFAGCAYVPVASEETGRRWIACDISPRSFTIIRRQFAKKPELGMTVEGEEGDYAAANPRFEGKGVLRVRGPNQLPKRSAGDSDAESLRLRVNLPEIKFRQRPLESGADIWRAFVEEWGTDCWYCGTQQPEDRRCLRLDHIEPNKGDGANDDCWNRALACIACSGDKSDRLTPTQTMDKALADGRMPTQRRRDEMGDLFGVRQEWARERYESLPKAKELAGLQTSS